MVFHTAAGKISNVYKSQGIIGCSTWQMDRGAHAGTSCLDFMLIEEPCPRPVYTYVNNAQHIKHTIIHNREQFNIYDFTLTDRKYCLYTISIASSFARKVTATSLGFRLKIRQGASVKPCIFQSNFNTLLPVECLLE